MPTIKIIGDHPGSRPFQVFIGDFELTKIAGLCGLELVLGTNVSDNRVTLILEDRVDLDVEFMTLPLYRVESRDLQDAEGLDRFTPPPPEGGEE